MAQLGRPTGPKPGFTREQVVSAALEVGIAEFTLARVAARLGVTTSALYRTISSREDLLRACLEDLAARAGTAPDPGDWRATLRNQAQTLWTLLEDHPGLDRVLLTTSWAGDCFADIIAAIHTALVAAGMSPDEAALAVDMVGDTVISSHIGVIGLRSQSTTSDGRPEDSHLPSSFHPDPSWMERGWLDRKIDLILDGLRARMEAPATTPAGAVPGRGSSGRP